MLTMSNYADAASGNLGNFELVHVKPEYFGEYDYEYINESNPLDDNVETSETIVKTENDNLEEFGNFESIPLPVDNIKVKKYEIDVPINSELILSDCEDVKKATGSDSATDEEMSGDLINDFGIACPDSTMSTSYFSADPNSKSDDNSAKSQKPYKCNTCQISYSTLSNLQRHLQIHFGVKPHECKLCGDKFSLKGQLNAHFMLHSTIEWNSQKPYKCNTCQISYSTSSNLRRHLQIHNGVKPHECEVCGDKFSLKGQLNAHFMLHSTIESNSVKPFECEMCRMKFTHLRYLKHHKATKHKNVRACEISDENFKTKPELQTRDSVNREIEIVSFQCNRCKTDFSTQRLLNMHLLSHECGKEYECPICHNWFALKSQLIDHLLVHKDIKPNICDVCNRRFSSKRNLTMHLQLHATRQPYKCDICNSEFLTQWNLKKHLKSHASSKPYLRAINAIRNSRDRVI